MSWLKIEELCKVMEDGLLRRGVPVAAVACSEASERAVDAWLERYRRDDPSLTLPSDPEQLRLLLARFRYAGALAMQCATHGLPFPPGPGGDVLHVMLTKSWYEDFREQWLSGRKGLDFQSN